MPKIVSKAQMGMVAAAAHGKARKAKGLSRQQAAQALAEFKSSGKPYGGLPARKKKGGK